MKRVKGEKMQAITVERKESFSQWIVGSAPFEGYDKPPIKGSLRDEVLRIAAPEEIWESPEGRAQIHRLVTEMQMTGI